jgi:heptosyltransferase-2
MNIDSTVSEARKAAAEAIEASKAPPADRSPILIVPYMWIGDFVRCHSVVKLLRARFPERPVDMLATPLCAPLADYMPGLRRAIVAELPRRRLALRRQKQLADRLRAEGYGSALIMPRTWKSAIAPWLAAIPQRIGFAGEARFFLVNDMRFGERRLARMVDRCCALALPKDAAAPAEWPMPELKVPLGSVAVWRELRGLAPDGRPVAALAPGAVGVSKRWPAAAYAELARRLAAEGLAVWVLGGPDEKPLAAEIAAGSPAVDLTGHDLRDAILALAAASVAVSNDSGLLHVAAALGTPSIGIFGPTSAWHWAPLNPLAATIASGGDLPCRPCHAPVCRLGHHRCMREIAADEVLTAVRRALQTTAPPPPPPP